MVKDIIDPYIIPPNLHYYITSISNELLNTIEKRFKEKQFNEALTDSVALTATIILSILSQIGVKYPIVADHAILLLYKLITDESVFMHFIQTINKMIRGDEHG